MLKLILKETRILKQTVIIIEIKVQKEPRRVSYHFTNIVAIDRSTIIKWPNL